MPDAVDQLAPDARVERGDQAEPQAAEPGRQHRHGQHHATQTALARVLAHQVRVGHPIRSADLVDGASGRFRVQRLQQVGEQIVDPDRLRRHRDPARRDEDREVLHERADHLEREAAGADHDRRAQLDHRNARVAQQATDLEPAAQVRRELLALVRETAEVDDPPHARGARRRAEVSRRTPVLLLEAAGRPHRVDQVVGRLDAGQGLGQALARDDVARDDLRLRGDPRRQMLGLARQAADPMSAVLESPQQPPAHVAGGARQQHAARRSSSLGSQRHQRFSSGSVHLRAVQRIGQLEIFVNIKY